MNIAELRSQVARSGKTAKQLCAAIGISESAWFRKTRGINEFTQNEIITLRRELNLDDHQTALIFFNEEVS